MMLPAPFLRRLSLALLVLCVSCVASCRQPEQEERKAFIAFLETELSAAGTGGVQMSDAVRKKIGGYSRHFDVIATYAKELEDINALLAGEKTRIAANGPVAMDKLGSARSRIEQLVVAFSRSAQQIDAVQAKADAAKAALKQPEDVQAAFNRAYARAVGEYAAASQALYAVQKDFYAEALRMSEFCEKHRDKIQFKNRMAIIDEQALRHEYNTLQRSLREKSQKMQAALASGRPPAR